MMKVDIQWRTTAGLILLLLWATGCGIPREQYDADLGNMRKIIDETRMTAHSLETALEQSRAENEMLETEIAGLRTQLTVLAGERDANMAAVEKARGRVDLFREMLHRFKSMTDAGTIRIQVINNRMVVQMASAILFSSGSERLSREGREALASVAEVLSSLEGRVFQVAGHTDNKPIATARFSNNWELSAARAVSVVEHLIRHGMLPASLSAAGYADTQPVSSNETEEGRSMNRRIEIVLQPDLNDLPDLSSFEKMVVP
jgi:chemotaxis protein MotB